MDSDTEIYLSHDDMENKSLVDIINENMGANGILKIVPSVQFKTALDKSWNDFESNDDLSNGVSSCYRMIKIADRVFCSEQISENNFDPVLLYSSKTTTDISHFFSNECVASRAAGVNQMWKKTIFLTSFLKNVQEIESIPTGWNLNDLQTPFKYASSIERDSEFAFTPFTIEQADLPKITLLLPGSSPKVFLTLKRNDQILVNEVIRRNKEHVCVSPLCHNCFFIDSDKLHEMNIEPIITYQHANEFIVLDSGTCYASANLGVSVSEVNNFYRNRCLPTQIQRSRCDCRRRVKLEQPIISDTAEAFAYSLEYEMMSATRGNLKIPKPVHIWTLEKATRDSNSNTSQNLQGKRQMNFSKTSKEIVGNDGILSESENRHQPEGLNEREQKKTYGPRIKGPTKTNDFLNALNNMETNVIASSFSQVRQDGGNQYVHQEQVQDGGNQYVHQEQVQDGGNQYVQEHLENSVQNNEHPNDYSDQNHQQESNNKIQQEISNPSVNRKEEGCSSDQNNQKTPTNVEKMSAEKSLVSSNVSRKSSLNEKIDDGSHVSLSNKRKRSFADIISDEQHVDDPPRKATKGPTDQQSEIIQTLKHNVSSKNWYQNLEELKKVARRAKDNGRSRECTDPTALFFKKQLQKVRERIATIDRNIAFYMDHGFQKPGTKRDCHALFVDRMKEYSNEDYLEHQRELVNILKKIYCKAKTSLLKCINVGFSGAEIIRCFFTRKDLINQEIFKLAVSNTSMPDERKQFYLELIENESDWNTFFGVNDGYRLPWMEWIGSFEHTLEGLVLFEKLDEANLLSSEAENDEAEWNCYNDNNQVTANYSLPFDTMEPSHSVSNDAVEKSQKKKKKKKKHDKKDQRNQPPMMRKSQINFDFDDDSENDSFAQGSSSTTKKFSKKSKEAQRLKKKSQKRVGEEKIERNDDMIVKRQSPNPVKVISDEIITLSSDSDYSQIDKDLSHINYPVSRNFSIENYSKETFKKYSFNFNEKNFEDASECGRLRIPKKELYRLAPTEWLSNFVVDEYFSLIQERSDKLSIKCLIIGSNGGIETCNVLRRYKKWMSADITFVFAPVIHSKHFGLIVINVKEKKWFLFDSLKGNEFRNVKNVAKIITRVQSIVHMLWLVFKHEEINFSEWTELLPEELLSLFQSNGYDCGMFVCLLCEYLSRKAKVVEISPTEMSRKLVASELLNGELYHQEITTETENTLQNNENDTVVEKLAPDNLLDGHEPRNNQENEVVPASYPPEKDTMIEQLAPDNQLDGHEQRNIQKNEVVPASYPPVEDFLHIPIPRGSPMLSKPTDSFHPEDPDSHDASETQNTVTFKPVKEFVKETFNKWNINWKVANQRNLPSLCGKNQIPRNHLISMKPPLTVDFEIIYEYFQLIIARSDGKCLLAEKNWPLERKYCDRSGYSVETTPTFMDDSEFMFAAFCPNTVGNLHFVLFIMDISQKTYFLYDPLGCQKNNNTQQYKDGRATLKAIENLKNNIEVKIIKENGHAYNWDEWKEAKPDNLVTHYSRNVNDSGIYISLLAEQFTRGVLDVNVDNISTRRELMVAELLNGSLYYANDGSVHIPSV